MRALPIALCLMIPGCSACERPAVETPADEPTTEAEPSSDEPAEAEDEPEAARAPRPTRPTTARERAARLQSMPADERTRLRRRSELLAEGRRLGHEGDHEASLAAFEAALRVAPLDVTVMCEAGNQALRLERYEQAATHLEAAVARSAPPRTLAMCLYNLGRVREAQERPYDAHRSYSRSLALRPNRIVQGRLDALDVELDELEAQEDEELEPQMVDTSRIEGRTFPTLAALAAAAHCGQSWATDEALPAVPTPRAALRELALHPCGDEEMRYDITLLCARTDEGWTLVEEVARSDMGDTFGRLEATEMTRVLFDGDHVIVLVSGGVDERDGEAEAYWQCEEQHPDDADAVMDCFDLAEDELGERERWTRATRYTLEDGALVGAPIEEPAPYFARLEGED